VNINTIRLNPEGRETHQIGRFGKSKEEQQFAWFMFWVNM